MTSFLVASLPNGEPLSDVVQSIGKHRGVTYLISSNPLHMIPFLRDLASADSSPNSTTPPDPLQPPDARGFHAETEENAQFLNQIATKDDSSATPSSTYPYAFSAMNPLQGDENRQNATQLGFEVNTLEMKGPEVKMEYEETAAEEPPSLPAPPIEQGSSNDISEDVKIVPFGRPLLNVAECDFDLIYGPGEIEEEYGVAEKRVDLNEDVFPSENPLFSSTSSCVTPENVQNSASSIRNTFGNDAGFLDVNGNAVGYQMVRLDSRSSPVEEEQQVSLASPIGQESSPPRQVYASVNMEPFDAPLLISAKRENDSGEVEEERGDSGEWDWLDRDDSGESYPKIPRVSSNCHIVFRDGMQNLVSPIGNPLRNDDDRQDVNTQRTAFEMDHMDSEIFPPEPEVKEEQQQSTAVMMNSLPAPTLGDQSPRDIFADVKAEPFGAPLLNPEGWEIDLTTDSDEEAEVKEEDEFGGYVYVEGSEDKALPPRARSPFVDDFTKVPLRDVKYELLDKPLLNPAEWQVDLSDDSDDFLQSDSEAPADPDDEEYIPKGQPSKKTAKHKCGVCNKVFKKLGFLKNHHKREHQKVKKTPIAKRILKRDERKADLAEEKSNEPEEDDIVMDSEALVDSDDEDYTPKGRSSKKTKKNRNRKHNGEKPYECDVCHKKFSQNHHRRAHTRIHTGEKPYQCDVCQMRFGVKRVLADHMHTHSGEKPFQCDVCQMNFSQSRYLRDHIRRVHK